MIYQGGFNTAFRNKWKFPLVPKWKIAVRRTISTLNLKNKLIMLWDIHIMHTFISLLTSTWTPCFSTTVGTARLTWENNFFLKFSGVGCGYKFCTWETKKLLGHKIEIQRVELTNKLCWPKCHEMLRNIIALAIKASLWIGNGTQYRKYRTNNEIENQT